MIKQLLANAAVRLLGTDALYWANPAGWRRYFELGGEYETRAKRNWFVNRSREQDEFGRFETLVALKNQNGDILYEEVVWLYDGEVVEHLTSLPWWNE